MAFLLANASNLAQAAGLGDTKFGQGLAGFEAEQEKAKGQVGVFIALFVALALGITTVILLSTGVSDLETYGDYFKSTGHKVGLGFAGATLLALLIAFFMLNSATECAEDTQQQMLMQPAAAYPS